MRRSRHHLVAAAAVTLATACGGPRKLDVSDMPELSDQPTARPQPGATTVTTTTPPPEVELVTAVDETLTFFKTSAHGLVEERRVQLPGMIDALYWLDADPVVLLGSGRRFDLDDAPATGQVVIVGRDGVHPLPLVPPAAWQTPRPRGADHLEPRWQLIATAQHELWEGRCEWGIAADDAPCTTWVWVRLRPEPMGIARTAPTAIAERPLPRLAPPAGWHAELRDYQPPAPVDIAGEPAGAAPPPVKVLRCHDAVSTNTYEFPPAEERDDGFLGMEGLAWISLDPPMLATSVWQAGDQPSRESMIFDGCTPSGQWQHASVEGGPSDLAAMYQADHVSVFWRGREIGVGPGAQLLRFAPR